MASPTAQPRRRVERIRKSDIGPSWSATKKPSPNPTRTTCTTPRYPTPKLTNAPATSRAAALALAHALARAPAAHGHCRALAAARLHLDSRPAGEQEEAHRRPERVARVEREGRVARVLEHVLVPEVGLAGHGGTIDRWGADLTPNYDWPHGRPLRPRGR